jgi:putative oxidoreductase
MSSSALPSAGLLVLRLVVGVTFLLHGLDKLGDSDAAERFFASLDIPAPSVVAPFVGLTETGGGLLLIAGLGTPLVGAALGIDMLVALATAHDDVVFFVAVGGIELELLLAGASFAVALTGAGRFSADSALDLPGHVAASRADRWTWRYGDVPGSQGVARPARAPVPRRPAPRGALCGS